MSDINFPAVENKAAALRRQREPAHCPCCGRPIPPQNLFANSPVKARIFRFIAAHPEGVSRRRILDAVWADDPDGGPEFANVISVHVKAMRSTLAHEGLTITCARGPGATYRLAALADGSAP